jgi:hypothetical protein
LGIARRLAEDLRERERGILEAQERALGRGRVGRVPAQEIGVRHRGTF